MQIGDRAFAGYPSYKWSGLPDTTALAIPEETESRRVPASTPIPTDLGTSSSLADLLWRSQSQAGDATTVDAGSGDASSSEDILEEFKKWASMTPAEKIRASFLQRHHLTEEQLAQMPPEERQKIEDEISREIKQQLGIDENAGAETKDGTIG